MSNEMKANVKEEFESIASQNETAKHIVDEIASRKRHRDEPMSLGRFRNILKKKYKAIVDNDFDNTFSRFQELGIGKLSKGKHGRLLRFKWDANVRGLAQLLAGQESSQPVEHRSKRGRPKKESVLKTMEVSQPESLKRFIGVIQINDKIVKLSSNDALTPEEFSKLEELVKAMAS